MRLIDADALKERWTIASPAPYSIWDAAEVLDTINEAPTVVEVVRCWECKDYAIWTDGRAMNYCDKHCHRVDADDFCSLGRRKDDVE